MTDELKTVYHIQTEIWHLFKKYAADNPDMGQLFKDMYTALINYYRRKESGQ